MTQVGKRTLNHKYFFRNCIKVYVLKQFSYIGMAEDLHDNVLRKFVAVLVVHLEWLSKTFALLKIH